MLKFENLLKNNTETFVDADQLPGPSATDRFQSPVSQSVNRQLFKTVSSGQTVVQKTTASGTPKRTGSLSIIFRKVSYLSCISF